MLLTMALVSGCGHAVAGSQDTSVRKVAFFQDLSVDDPVELVSPSFLALDLRLRNARDEGAPSVPDTVQFDTAGDPAVAIQDARAVAADPSYVAAVIAPFYRLPAAASDLLAAARVTTFSLSSLTGPGWSPPVRDGGPFLALVGDQDRQAELMADAASGAGDEGPCVAGDGSAWSKSLQPALLRSLGATEASVLPAGSPDMIAGDARTAGCRRLVWTGGTTEAAVLRDRLPRSITMVGSDAMRTTAYLSAATGTGADTIATCSCVDVNLSIAPAAQRFVNVYQSSSGLTPGIYAAEGWDLGGILVLLGRTGDSHRDQISAGASGVHRYVGVARTYRFGEAGGVTARSVPPKASMASGSRWVPVDG